MKLKIFTVYDIKAEAYLKPFFAQTNAVAIRSLADSVNSGDAQNMVAQHPEDYSLFLIGSWSESDGLIDARTHKKHLIDCVDLVDSRERDFRNSEGMIDSGVALVDRQAG